MSEIVERIVDRPRFRQYLLRSIRSALASEIGIDDVPSEDRDLADISYGLLTASGLTSSRDERAQDAVLRVAHSVLRNPATTPEQQAAALILLERVGNQPGVLLALERYEVDALDYATLPITIAGDTIARRSELVVRASDGSTIEVNPFQRDFWSLVHSSDWVSVSAPTSAGKSHIVREWMLSEIARAGTVRLVYLAPTRALVEEVGAFFRANVGKDVGVHTLPWDPDIAEHDRQIFILTQERMHLLQERSPQFSPDAIFIDEAQKISEGTRGILLSQVLDEAVMRDANIRLVFASPLSKNPAVLLGSHNPARSVAALVGDSVTVNQNLIYVRQKPRKSQRYAFDFWYSGETHEIGEIDLVAAPTRVGERVPFVAASVGRLSTGNLVYANGPAEAEKYARLIYEALGADAVLATDGIRELIDFAKGTVHERYVLAEYATRGVAYHYGDMPLVLKAKVEELFKRGELRYLVCTSTLLEGVNLPCRNIFMRGPRKGPARMSLSDFWNLAGRAGRWGKEFQGNIFCIDAQDARVWPALPAARERTEITPAASTVLDDVAALTAYIDRAAPKAESAEDASIESVFSWLSGRLLGHDDLHDLTGVEVQDVDQARLDVAVRSAVAEISLPDSIVKRHAGISPLSMQRMLDAMISHGHPEELTLVPPTVAGAKAEYEKALTWVADHLGGSFANSRRRLQLSGLIVNWMAGMRLSHIIEGRAKYRRENGIEFNYPKLIRDTLSDVEDIARYEAPKYLSCYSDIVRVAASLLGRELEEEVSDVEMMLELGVPRGTDMSFIAVGLSRATCAEISSYIRQDNWSPAECAAWLRDLDLESLDIAPFAMREIRTLRESESARRWS